MNLKNTIECGQFFRYKKEGEGYVVQTRNKVFYVEPGKEAKFNNFFNLDVTPKTDLKIQMAGIRIINQDPWECLISFVCSSASNIPRIKKNIEKLCELFGKEVKFKGKKYYAFPETGRINNLSKIKKAGVGFRAKYIHEINKIVSRKYFENLKTLSYNEAKKELMKLPGVGEKIADCVCLYSLKHFQAFPIDTWIKRVLKEKYGFNGSYEKMSFLARKEFGEHAGWVQQYLYFCERTNKS